jgi:hypothetical protein
MAAWNCGGIGVTTLACDQFRPSDNGCVRVLYRILHSLIISTRWAALQRVPLPSRAAQDRTEAARVVDCGSRRF